MPAPRLTTRRRWNDAELVYVRQNYARAGSVAVGAALGRTPKAVRLVAQEMGIRREHWTAAELAQLAAERPVTPAAELTARYGRTERCIAERARRLGAARGPSHWTAEEEAELARCYAEEPWSDLVERFGRSRRSIIGKAHRMGLSKARPPARPRYRTTRPRWTRKEEVYLASRYPHVPTGALAREMARAPDQLHWKAAQLGIRKRDRLSEEARALLLELRDAPGIVEYFVETFGVGRAAVEGVLAVLPSGHENEPVEERS